MPPFHPSATFQSAAAKGIYWNGAAARRAKCSGRGSAARRGNQLDAIEDKRSRSLTCYGTRFAKIDGDLAILKSMIAGIYALDAPSGGCCCASPRNLARSDKPALTA
jgi:hypothetical protein